MVYIILLKISYIVKIKMLISYKRIIKSLVWSQIVKWLLI